MGVKQNWLIYHCWEQFCRRDDATSVRRTHVCFSVAYRQTEPHILEQRTNLDRMEGQSSKISVGPQTVGSGVPEEQREDHLSRRGPTARHITAVSCYQLKLRDHAGTARVDLEAVPLRGN